MSEQFLERLNRFTPDAGRLNRDELLFAAGRSSARANRGWMSLATVLAGTQALSLLLLWPHSDKNPIPPAGGITPAVAERSAAAPEPRASETLAGPGLWSARRSLVVPETEGRPSADVTFIDSGPPLRASRSIPPSLLN
jgi:hypothetical protein